MALLPRGRAWQTHEDVLARWNTPSPSQSGLFETGDTGLALDFEPRELTVMQQFWAAYAEVLEHMHQRACALLAEFFCSSFQETAPEWAIEYGFPDPCEPWDTICEKVTSVGGNTCAWLADIASRRGWVLTCVDCTFDATSQVGQMMAGCDVVCPCPPNELVIVVDTEASPAFTGDRTPFQAGAIMAGCTTPCGPLIEELICLIERVKPAHVRAVYVAI